MIKRSEDFSFLIGAIVSTLLMASILLAQNIKKTDTLKLSASKTESIHYVTIVNTRIKTEKKLPKKPIKKPRKRVVKKVEKKIVKKPQIVDEDAQIKEKLAQKEKLEQEILEQLQKEKLAREEEFRKTQQARKNLLEEQKDIYLSELAAWIKQHLKYPRHARRMNQQGVVKISFFIIKIWTY